MKFQDHVIESVKLFGNGYEAIHRWLDEFAGKPPHNMRHRKVRHHLAGLSEIEILFGKDAVPAAKQYIISDLKEEGWTEKDHFPENESDYINMGLF